MDTNHPAAPVSHGSGPVSPGPSGVPANPAARSPQTPGGQQPGLNPKIQHSRPLGQPIGSGGPHSLSHMEESLKPISRLNPDNRPLPVEEAGLPAVGNKITAFGNKDKRHEESWTRTPNTTGQGAIHVKTFHCKLTDEALTYMDQLINEWLDAHPQYEVKFCLSTIGTFTGKLKEPALICQVWV